MARTVGGVDFRILGPLEVLDHERRIHIPGRKEKALLALLLIELGTVVSADRIVFELWGDDRPNTATETLRTLVSRLRRQLGKNSIVTQRPGYRMQAEPEQVDSHRFEQLADQAFAVRHQPSTAAETCHRALTLWNGRALADFDGFRFAEQEARRLGHRRLQVEEIAFDSGLSLGRHSELIPEISRAVDDNQLHEPLYGQLMLALYRSGRPAEALTVYATLEKLLGEELGIEPSQSLRDLERSIVVEDPSLEFASQETPNNLPAILTSFIGRERELEALTSIVPRRRMVTLTGPGGSGKSRLALETATRLLDAYRDGVWRVELAPVRDEDSVVPAITSVFGDPASHAADPIGSLSDLLRGRRVLLILDNCEHLLQATSSAVRTILERCHDMSVLATSREALGTPGESVWLVPPLGIPDVDNAAEEQEKAESVQLFVGRARDASSEFALTPENREPVFDICRLVEGLPLAVELAASQVPSMAPEALARRLSNDLGVLTTRSGSVASRHQTMRAALDWSYRLLDEESAAVFAGLAVFRGGWTLRDSEAVFGQGATPVIAGLVGRSLVERLRGTRLEYRLLEPIREYAKELFESSSDWGRTSALHADNYVELAGEADAALKGPEQMAWLGLMEEEHDNLRKALRWALDAGEARLALQLVAALGLFWFMGGHWKESLEWLTASLELAGPTLPAERARAVYRTASIQVIRVNHAAVLPLVEDALDICRSTGDLYGESWCLHLIGHAAAFDSPVDSLGPLTESRDLFAGQGYEWEAAWANRFVGASLCDVGRADEGLDLMLRSVSTFRELGDRFQTAYGLFLLGQNLLTLESHGPTEAVPYLRRALRVSEEIGDRIWSAHAMSRLGIAARLTHQDDAEPLLLDAAERHRLIGDDSCLAVTYRFLGELRLDAGDDSTAAGYFAQSIRVAQRIESIRSIAPNFDRIAQILLKRNQIEEARRLVAAVQTALDRGDLTLHPILQPVHGQVADLLEGPLGEGAPIGDLIPHALESAEAIRDEADRQTEASSG